jgi:hypothetical protein
VTRQWAGTDVVFISRLQANVDLKIIDIKFYSIDELLGLIGGIQTVFLAIVGTFLSPLS